MVSMTVHDRNVCSSDMPRNRLTSQNPESFTWERTVAPHAMAVVMAPTMGAE